MYTIVRFTRQPSVRDLFDEVGAHLNETCPGAYSGIRRAGDGFSTEICDSDSWEDHLKTIIGFLRKVKSSIEFAHLRGVSVCVDVAVEPEDLRRETIACLRADTLLIAMLAETGVEFEVSIYGPD